MNLNFCHAISDASLFFDKSAKTNKKLDQTHILHYYSFFLQVKNPTT